MRRSLIFNSWNFSPAMMKFGINKIPKTWALTKAENLRIRSVIDALVAYFFGLNLDDYRWILRHCDYPKKSLKNSISKGFWRVDKEYDPEIRQTVLSLIAFQDLQQKIDEFKDTVQRPLP